MCPIAWLAVAAVLACSTWQGFHPLLVAQRLRIQRDSVGRSGDRA